MPGHREKMVPNNAPGDSGHVKIRYKYGQMKPPFGLFMK